MDGFSPVISWDDYTLHNRLLQYVMVSFMCQLTGLRNTQIVGKTICVCLCVSARVFPEEINIQTGELGEADGPS